MYVDAFAGTGFRRGLTVDKDEADLLFDVSVDQDADALRKGSAYIALETTPPFTEYFFIERHEAHVQELEQLRGLFPSIADRITIVPEDANTFLHRWCQAIDWQRHRAVVFLDPYGMQVEWSTIATMAATQGIDLWVLFPLGMAVNRLLRRNRPPEGAWAQRLTVLFGTDAWQQAFYLSSTQQDLFGAAPDTVRDADFARISQFWVERLQTVFTQVASSPLPLRNSRNVPIYLLCFAASNPRGAPTAVRIAQHILSR